MSTEETQQSARILLIDSHPITLLGLNALLEASSDYEVVDKLSSASGITEILKQKRPDLVLMDLHLPKTNGINLIREINAATENSAKIVILTSALSQAETCDLIRTGVKGIILKEM
ncbi:MAG: response regulator transcription factor, partial [Daejeonella sp.]|nr:response regulator transcription factor [Daejeonella sp.]